MQKHKFYEVLLAWGLIFLGLLWSSLSFPESLQCYKPNLLLITVFYVLVFMPKRLNIIGAWVVGLLADSLHGFVLGSYALQFSFLAFVVNLFYARVAASSVIKQSIFLIVIGFLMAVINMGIYKVIYETFSSCELYSLLPTALFWVVFYFLAGSLHKNLFYR